MKTDRKICQKTRQKGEKKEITQPTKSWWKGVCSCRKTQKKDASGNLYKHTTENRPYFNKGRIFTINKRV